MKTHLNYRDDLKIATIQVNPLYAYREHIER